jgi:Tol biopolymer transport system component
MKQWHQAVFWLALTCLLAGCTPGTPTSPPPAPSPIRPQGATPTLPPSGEPVALDTPHLMPSSQPRITFHTNRDGNYEIYVMDADGSNLANLTNHLSRDQSPAWSPDGTRIAFHSDREGSSDLYIMFADGTDVTRLTYDPDTVSGAAWSPDGTQLAYTAKGGSQIHVMNADGTGETQVTDLLGFNGTPAWSPTVDPTIAFYYEDKHYSSAVHSIRPDGTKLVRLTSGGSYHDIHPSWSPQGDQIVFGSERVGHLKSEIFVTDVRRSNDDDWPEVIQLTDTGGNAWSPDWSPILPDGSTFIAFSRRDGDNGDIYVMAPDGSDLVQLTDDPADDDGPDWAPLP